MKKSDIAAPRIMGGSSTTGHITGGDLAAMGAVGEASKTGSPIFREVQRMQAFRVWLPIAMVAGAAWYEFFRRLVFEDSGVTYSIPDWIVVILTVVFGIGTPVLGLLTMRLVTEVRPGLLTVRLTPFPRAKLPLEVIKIAKIREYAALKEYRGYGVKAGRHSGRAYTARGDKGVQMVLANGSLLLIGTQRPTELMAALRSAGAELEETSGKGRRQGGKAAADTRRPKP